MADGKPKQRKGFALQSPERRKEIAAQGGRSVASADRSFSRDPDLASRAGAKGGMNNKAPRVFEANRELAREAGRLGGLASRKSASDLD